MRVSPRQPVVLMGSCFSENIGGIMRRMLWDARVNPCGTIFNPASLARILRMALGEATPSPVWSDSSGIWRSWDFPSFAASTSRIGCEEKCANALAELQKALEDSHLLIVTFGTAYVYELASGGNVVVNCHKQPAALFNKRAMSIGEISQQWIELLRQIADRYPQLRVMFTVSPVRHVRDGFAANSLSKSILRVAVDEICRATNSSYFPAFEILTDDLRDYRFYASDLVHPSAEASEYIFGKFCETYLDKADIALLDEGLRLNARAAHRPLIPGTADAERFAQTTTRMIDDWKRTNPQMLAPDYGTN